MSLQKKLRELSEALRRLREARTEIDALSSEVIPDDGLIAEIARERGHMEVLERRLSRRQNGIA